MTLARILDITFPKNDISLVQNKTIDMMVEGHDEATPEDKNLLPPQSPRLEHITLHTNSAHYLIPMKKLNFTNEIVCERVILCTSVIVRL